MKSLFNLFRVNVPESRVFGLDVLRAMAITFVMLWHSTQLMTPRIRTVVEYVCFDGVAIFFVLSGFLIGTILIRTFSHQEAVIIPLGRFWINRWFRTLPAYYLVLLIYFLTRYFFYGTVSKTSVVPFLFFMQNLWYPFAEPLFGESWSLAVEEWFYFITPLLIGSLIALFKLPLQKSVVLTACLIIMATTAFRLYCFGLLPTLTAETLDYLLRKQVVTRLDACMYGVVGAFVAYYYPKLWTRYKTQLLVFGMGLVLIVQVFMVRTALSPGLFATVFSFSATSLATLCMLPYLSSWMSTTSRVGYFISHLSLVSYSIYLLNLLVLLDLVSKIDNVNSGAVFYLVSALKYGMFWFITVVLATLLYKYVELPTTALREPFKKRTKQLSAVH